MTEIQTINIVDPRTLDGNPYEVAEQAAAQAEALTQLALRETGNALRMGRNAASERSLVITGAVPEAAYETTGEGRAFEAATELLTKAALRLASLTKAVAFDPKARVPKGGK